MEYKSFAVIGLGVFGYTIATELAELGNDVMVVDQDESIINEIGRKVTDAYTADITRPNVIEDLGIKNVDTVIISMGTNLEATIITTLKCKELGVKNTIVKATDDINAKIFKKIGADRVVIPEEDMGRKLAHSLTSTNLVDLVELSDDYSIIELSVPASWIGKTIYDLDIRKKFGVNIMAITNEDNVKVNPIPTEYFNQNDSIIIIGSNDQIRKIEEID